MSSQKITAAEAIKAFRGKSIQVQTPTPVKVKDDKGIERTRYKTSMQPLREEDIIGAAKRDDGSVVIVTGDGQRHSTAGSEKSAA